MAPQSPKKGDEFLTLVGSSPAFTAVREQTHIVAPFDLSVLILGESGTGKERIAQAIHRLSNRSLKPIIKINCAAIPPNLLESELFGHEKGAFTGALERRIGKFEQASGGTLFLDEIGELSLDLQAKLLCVLQEKEIVRLGSNKVVKTDVRMIAATNRDVEKEVVAGKFRLDLYYRLSVFPIRIPSLKDRRQDIPELTNHFLDKLTRKFSIKRKMISEVALEQLMNYAWPGNIRELENLMERTVIMTKGDTIQEITLPDEPRTNIGNIDCIDRVKTMKEIEREHIIEVLQRCNGRVAGPGGAAELLDMPKNTLIAKIRKLGIIKDFC